MNFKISGFFITVPILTLVLIVFHNPKNYDFHLIMQKLGKLNSKLNAMLNALKKCMSFTINSKIDFIESFEFLSFSLGRLAKNVSENDFKYVSQAFDVTVLDLVKQK